MLITIKKKNIYIGIDKKSPSFLREVIFVVYISRD